MYELIQQIKEIGHLTDRQLGLLDLLEEAMKPKICDGCKWEHIKGNNWSCKDCRRSPSYADMYEPKDTPCV